MARQVIDLGTSPNRGDGDPLRTAFDKINDNFAELYAGNFTQPDQTASDLVPSTDATYNLGSANRQWADLHVADFIYLNGTRLEVDSNKNLRLDGVTIAADSQGSVFADDSTILVDAVAGKIRGDIESATVDITSTVGDVNITAADDIDLTTTDSNGDIRLYSAGDIRFSAATGIDIFDTDSIYAEVTNDIDFIANAGTARLYANGRLDLVSETDQFNIEGVNGYISVETDLLIFTNANTANNPTGTNNNILLRQNGNIRAEAFEGDIYNDSGDTKLLDASQEELLCDVAFTPDAVGGWDTYWADPKPQTVAEALDRLASAIYSANGGTPV